MIVATTHEPTVYRRPDPRGAVARRGGGWQAGPTVLAPAATDASLSCSRSLPEQLHVQHEIRLVRSIGVAVDVFEALELPEAQVALLGNLRWDWSPARRAILHCEKVGADSEEDRVGPAVPL
eukprot:3565880-Prymnesium_polylepis.1